MCTIITGLSVLSAAAGLYSGVAQARNAQAQGEAQATALEANARNADILAHDAVERGGQEELSLRRSLAQLGGNQRVQAASSGVDIDSGSAVDARHASISEGERDAEAIRFNAARERWGYLSQADSLRSQAAYSQAAGKYKADNLLFGTVTKFGLDLGEDIYKRTKGESPLTEGLQDNRSQYWNPEIWREKYALSKRWGK